MKEQQRERPRLFELSSVTSTIPSRQAGSKPSKNRRVQNSRNNWGTLSFMHSESGVYVNISGDTTWPREALDVVISKTLIDFCSDERGNVEELYRLTRC